MSRKFEERILETLRELSRSCRSLANRSNTIADLAGTDASLGVYSHQSRVFAKHLAEAVASVESMLEDRGEDQGMGPAPMRLESLDIKGASGNLLSSGCLPSPEGTIRKQPSLQGSSTFVSIADLVGFLGNMGASGTLNVTTLDEAFTLVFEDGRLTHAVSDNAPEGGRLGDLLVEQGALSEMRLKSFLLRNKASKRKLGEALMLEEQVTERELLDALEEQVRRLFVRLFDADGASFEFLDGACPEESVAIQMGVQGLLLESAVAADHGQRSA